SAAVDLMDRHLAVAVAATGLIEGREHRRGGEKVGEGVPLRRPGEYQQRPCEQPIGAFCSMGHVLSARPPTSILGATRETAPRCRRSRHWALPSQWTERHSDFAN